MTSHYGKLAQIALAAVALCMTLVAPTHAFAATAASGAFECNPKASWSLDENGDLRISGSGKTGADGSLYQVSDSVLTATIGRDITSIGFETFCYFTNLKSVRFEEGSRLASIGGYAFNNCQALTSILIPDGVTTIGNSAFSGCYKLSTARTGSNSSLKVIGTSAFSNCSSLKTAVTSDKLVTISNYAFNGCSSLTSVTIPKSVTTVGEGAFNNCSSLATVTVLNPSKTRIASSALNGTKAKSSKTAKKISVKSIGKAGKGKLKVTWSKVAGAKKYVVYYKRVGAKSFKHKTVTGAKKKSTTLKKLKSGKRYIIFVKAKTKSKTICKSAKKKSSKVK